MSEALESTDSHSRLFLMMASGTGYPRKTVSADDNGRWFSGFVKPSAKKSRKHVERVLRRMGR